MKNTLQYNHINNLTDYPIKVVITEQSNVLAGFTVKSNGFAYNVFTNDSGYSLRSEEYPSTEFMESHKVIHVRGRNKYRNDEVMLFKTLKELSVFYKLVEDYNETDFPAHDEKTYQGEHRLQQSPEFLNPSMTDKYYVIDGLGINLREIGLIASVTMGVKCEKFHICSSEQFRGYYFICNDNGRPIKVFNRSYYENVALVQEFLNLSTIDEENFEKLVGYKLIIGEKR